MVISLPASVRVLRDFVNTAEPQLGTDRLTLESASEVLQRIGLLARAVPLAKTDLALVVGVREGLREMLIRNAGHDTGLPPRDELDRLLSTVPLTMHLTEEAPSVRAVRDRPAHETIAAVLSAVISTQRDEWMRLKVCARDSCRWAFFDTSRNRSGRWCSMAGCGNITKMQRAHQTRRGAEIKTG